MAFIQKDRVRESSPSTGVGDFTLAGAQAGYQSFSNVMSIGDTCVYFAVLPGGGWESGVGTYSAANTLTRTTVKESSNGGSLVVFAAGTKDVMMGPIASQSISPAGAQSFSASEKSQLHGNIGPRPQNKIVNSAFMVSQENGSTPVTVSGGYPVDQFSIGYVFAGAVSAAQVASPTPGGSPNRLRVTVTTADASVAAGDLLVINQKIEGLRVADFKFGTANAKTVTLQFGVKAPAGTYSVVLLNSALNRSYVAEYVISGGEANTDVVKSVTFAGDLSGTWLTTNGVGLEVRWGLMAGTTYQQAAGSWSTGR